MTRWSFDAKCMELVEHFLADYPMATDSDKRDFAQQLQEVCEGKCREFDEIIAAHQPRGRAP